MTGSTSPASRSIISSRAGSSGTRVPAMHPRTVRNVFTASPARRLSDAHPEGSRCAFMIAKRASSCSLDQSLSVTDREVVERYLSGAVDAMRELL